MKIKLFILSFTLLFVACSNDEDNISPEDKTYDLYSMEWRLEDGDGEEIIEKVFPDQEFSNTGSTTIFLEFSSKDEMEETSKFSSDDPNAFPTLINGIKEVPITDYPGILSETYGFLVSSLTAPYQPDKATIEPSLVTTHGTDLHPNCKLTYKRTIRIKKIKASYRAYFIDKKGDTGYEVRGKWEGEFHGGGNNEAIFTPLD